MLRSFATAILLVVSACNPFRQQPAVEVDPNDSARYSTWHATLTSPENLAGVVQMEGTATMAPTQDSSATVVTVELSNASPGGLHPWEARIGRCGSDGRLFGSAQAYGDLLEIGSDGLASASGTVDVRTPMRGDYFLVVRASPSNRSTIVACGNFAAPSR